MRRSYVRCSPGSWSSLVTANYCMLQTVLRDAQMSSVGRWPTLEARPFALMRRGSTAFCIFAAEGDFVVL